jgi:hypothetical protein
MVPDAGGNKTKKSLHRTFAVIWEGAEGTQAGSSQPGIRGTRFARTMMSENTHIQTTAHCARVRRRERDIRGDSIGTPPSEDSSTLPFYTRGAERESRPSHGRGMPAPRLRSRFDTASRTAKLVYCLP